MSDNVELVQLSQQDGKAIMAITAKIGWDLGRPDWETILACGPVFGHRCPDGSLQSIGAIFPSGPTCAAIGAVMVDPDFQGKGLGRAVVEKCMSPLTPDSNAFLIATPEGEKLYKSLGFKVIGETIRMEVDGAKLSSDEQLPGIRVRDLVNVVKLDAAAFGGQRYGMLKRRITQSNQAAVIEDDDGNTIGFALAIPKRDALRIGPMAAPDANAALRLINYLGAGHDGMVRVEVPGEQADLLNSLNQVGFQQVLRANVMSLDGKPLPGNRDTYMAIDSESFC